MRLVVVVLAMLVGTASAGTPQVRIGAPFGAAIEHARFEVSARSEHTHALLTLTMTSESETRVNGETILYVPRGTRVVGMTVTIGEGPSSAAVAMWRSAAAERYREIRGIDRDPGLVEWVGSHAGRDRYSVEVFPIVLRVPARIAIEMELPVTRRLEIDTGHEIAKLEVVNSTTRVHEAFAKPVRVAVPASSDKTVPVLAVARVAVSEMTSLFADEPGRFVAPDGPTLAQRIETMRPDDEEEAIAQMEFRRKLRARTQLLRSCVDTRSHGRIDLRFAVLPSGKVSAISVDGDGTDQVKQCITKELATWTFAEAENVVMVSQPVVMQ